MDGKPYVKADIRMGEVLDAIVACDVSPVAREAGAKLVEAWIKDMPKRPDSAWPSLLVEAPFAIYLDEHTIIVGQCDRIARDSVGPVSSEWKSKKAPQIRKDGQAYKGQTEFDWLEEISQGPQLAVYSLAQREGQFWNGSEWVRLNVAEPRTIVRAINKDIPYEVWPKRWEDGFFAFPQTVLDSTRDALLVKAAALRAMRRSGLVPYQLQGKHCFNQYGSDCVHLGICRRHAHPPSKPVAFHATDPGFVAAELLGLDIADPELIVLSQSAYQTASLCAEKHRIEYEGHAKSEESLATQVGTVLHAGLAAVYRQRTFPIDK